MTNIIFSVIIPHKNRPDLLQYCLNSIPRRKDIQIIVVDDNSDEDKVNFNKFPGLDDEYVEIYLTKEGKGAGYARNMGLKHAKGKWLLFADADDFFTENSGF
jgi:glycosyltransferase involved in cell wall biosynthesis